MNPEIKQRGVKNPSNKKRINKYSTKIESSESEEDINSKEKQIANSSEEQKEAKNLLISLSNSKKQKLLRLPRTWIILATFRIVLNLFSQRSYIHPDEFFQGLEIISGDLFNCSSDVYRAWEFRFQFDNSSNIVQEPIRNMLVPYVFYGVPLAFLKLFSQLGSVKDYSQASMTNTPSEMNLVHVQSNTLVYYPRMFMSVCSLLIDFCILRVAELCDLDETSVLITFASSYVALIYLTRTFSNTIETILFALLVYLVIKSVKAQYVLNDKFLFASHSNKKGGDDSKIKGSKLIAAANKSFRTENEPQHDELINPEKKQSKLKRFHFFDIYKYDYLVNSIGFVLCVGIFNRPTFLIYAFVPIAYWLFYGLENCNNFRQVFMFVWRRSIGLIRVLGPLAFVFVSFDTLYFNQVDNVDKLFDLMDTKSITASRKHRKLIITPLNFFKYNSNANNLREHGEHPFYQHFLINCSLLFGLNHFVLIFMVLQFVVYVFVSLRAIKSQLQNEQDEHIRDLKQYSSVMVKEIYKQFINNTFLFFSATFLMPLFVFSLVAHQEPRFLLPLIIPVCLLTAHCLFGSQSYSFLRFVWIVFNAVLFVVYGYLHQGGVVSSLNHVQKMFSHSSNLQMDQHVIFYHTYMPPRFLAFAPFQANVINNKKYVYEQKKKLYEQMLEEEPSISKAKLRILDSFVPTVPTRHIYDLMSANQTQLEQLVRQIKEPYTTASTKVKKNFAIFLVAPSVLDFDLKKNLINENCPINAQKGIAANTSNAQMVDYQLATSFRFHITFEHLQDHIDLLQCKFKQISENLLQKGNLNCYANRCKKYNLLQRITNSFSLNLYQIIV
jgi:phosphatidylinositol glycan class Z